LSPSLPRVSFHGLLLAALGITGVAAIAIAATVFALRNDAIDDAINDTNNIATVLAEQTERAMQAIDIAVSEISDRIAKRVDLNPADYDKIFDSRIVHTLLADRDLRLPQTEFIELIDKRGRRVNSSRDYPVTSTNVSDREYFIKARDNTSTKMFTSHVVNSQLTGRDSIFFAKRISGTDGEFLGVILAGMKPEYFREIYRSLTSMQDHAFFLMRKDGTILLRYPDISHSSGRKPSPNSQWHKVMKEGGGLFQSSGSFDGEVRLISVKPIKEADLVVNVGLSLKHALAAWRYRATAIGAGTALGLICSLLLIYALYRQFAQLAASKASLIERENRLAEKTAELEDANDRLDTAINHIIQGLVMFNADGNLVVCNRRFIEVYGLPPEEIKPGVSIRRVLELRAAAGSFFDDIDTYLAELRRKMTAGELMTKITDFADGRTFCVTNQPTGNGGWVATHEDITERRRDEKELQQTRNMLRAMVENIPETLLVKDAKTRQYAFVNRAGEKLLGVPNNVVVGKTADELFPAEEAARVRARDDEAIQKGSLSIASREVSTFDGRERDVSSKRIVIADKDGDAQYILNIIEDVTDQLRGQRELEQARNMLGAVVESIPQMLVVKDAHTGRYIFVNRAGGDLLGVPKDDLIGKTTEEIFDKKQAEVILARDHEALRAGVLKVDFHTTRTLDNRLIDVASKRVAILGKDKKPEYLLTVIEDITERKRNETRIAHLAHHDPLTDLANRAAFNIKLAECVETAAARNAEFALLCIDLDRFKEVNDLYGHATGDKVLLEITARMRRAVGDTFLARLGGDEFMAICVDDPSRAAVTALAEHLVSSVSGDIDCDGRKVRIGMSIGAAMYPSDGTEMAALLRNADAALYRAKAEGGGAVRFFEADMDRVLHDRRALQADLALSVSRNELQLYYQPQARVNGQIIGFEALLRWDHLTRGFVPPDTFIPLAEESGLIDQIGEWVLREACREAATWRKPLQIAINLSPVQFRHQDFVPLVHAVLLETGLAPNRLVVEITEGALMDDYSRAISILRRLKALGIRIAMDDFGTGYSSLSYLQSFPFDKIKIDQTFIANLERNTQSGAIVRSVLGLGRSLNLTTVAEGVETQTQLAILQSEGCDEMQGYLIGRPQPISDYAEITGRPMRERRAVANG